MRIAIALAGVLVCFGSVPAGAQTETPHKGHRSGSSSSAASGARAHELPAGPLVLSRDAAAASIAAAARERMKKGDCAGALDGFDQALQEDATDPTLYRDRGLCHERLDQPYPAIDDYRAYLTAAPDGKDEDDIRERLQHLDDVVHGVAPHVRADDDVPPSEPALGPDTAEVKKPPPATPKMNGDDLDDRSPASLGAGTGWSLAPFFAARKWFRSGVSADDSETWAEAIGARVRVAFTAHSALVLEAGYERFDSTSSDAEIAYGLTSSLDYELRVPLNAAYDDQLLLGAGIGYDSVKYAAGESAAGLTYSEGVAAGHVRAGYRHMLASSVSLDVMLMGGAGPIVKYDSAVDAHSGAVGLAGADVALGWAL